MSFPPMRLGPFPLLLAGLLATLPARAQPLEHAALVERAASAHAVGEYERAAEGYEELARRYPAATADRCDDATRASGRCLGSPEALENAVFFRAALGQLDQAIADAEDFARLYGARLRVRTARLDLGVGRLLAQAGQHAKAARHLTAWLAHHGQTLGPADRIVAESALGDALSRTRDPAGATRAWTAAVQGWDALDATPSPRDDDPEAMALRAEAQAAAATARLALAEQAVHALDAPRWPAYHGGTNRAHLDAWIAGDLARFLAAEDAYVQAASRAYEATAATRPSPAAITAAARVGALNRAAFARRDDPPVPPALRGDPAALAAYRAAVRSASAGPRARALAAYEWCAALAVQTRQPTDDARACQAALTDLDPRRFPPLAELTPAAGATVDEAPPARLVVPAEPPAL